MSEPAREPPALVSGALDAGGDVVHGVASTAQAVPDFHEHTERGVGISLKLQFHTGLGFLHLLQRFRELVDLDRVAIEEKLLSFGEGDGFPHLRRALGRAHGFRLGQVDLYLHFLFPEGGGGDEENEQDDHDVDERHDGNRGHSPAFRAEIEIHQGRSEEDERCTSK